MRVVGESCVMFETWGNLFDIVAWLHLIVTIGMNSWPWCPLSVTIVSWSLYVVMLRCFSDGNDLREWTILSACFLNRRSDVALLISIGVSHLPLFPHQLTPSSSGCCYLAVGCCCCFRLREAASLWDAGCVSWFRMAEKYSLMATLMAIYNSSISNLPCKQFYSNLQNETYIDALNDVVQALTHFYKQIYLQTVRHPYKQWSGLFISFTFQPFTDSSKPWYNLQYVHIYVFIINI